jgi:hypothetical protein
VFITANKSKDFAIARPRVVLGKLRTNRGFAHHLPPKIPLKGIRMELPA